VLKIDTAGNLLWTKKIKYSGFKAMNVINNNIYLVTDYYGFLLQKMDMEMNSSCFIYNDSLSLTTFNMNDTIIMLQHHTVNEIDTTLAVGNVNLIIYDSVHCNSLNIYQLSDNSALTISPNPASDKIYISFPAIPITIGIKIYSVTGEVVYEQENKIKKFQISNSSEGIHSDNFQTTIDVTGLSNGIYFLSVQAEKEIVTKKIVVNH
jgi:hypothetical protein